MGRRLWNTVAQYKSSSTIHEIPMQRMTYRHPIVLMALIAAALLPAGVASAQTKSRKVPRKTEVEVPRPADYQSKNFLVHTDLPKKEAQDLLERLETMLKLISRYWGRNNPRVIECFVVKDLKNWPPEMLQKMEPAGLAKIRSGAGVTISRVQTLGARFRAQAKVYAIADRNVPQHEAVHAYCHHAFGTSGPVWYSEGMAEMGKCWREKDFSVNCESYVVRYLRASPPKDLKEIVDHDQKTGDSWQNYAWRWALCHMLANNANYASRFRPLGLGLLTKRRTSFGQVYGPMAKEINFEYHLFLKHLEPGYRVDLCSWDWKTKFRAAKGPRISTSRIKADRGWQASRLTVKKGQEYQYSVKGVWQTTKDGDETTADGHTSGEGKLVGILFSDYKLGEPFELGEHGTFKAPGDGQLMLRCNDKWTQLADNKGRVTVKLKLKGEGTPLAKPENKVKAKADPKTDKKPARK